jgi:hypothetical protein
MICVLSFQLIRFVTTTGCGDYARPTRKTTRIAAMEIFVGLGIM